MLNIVHQKRRGEKKGLDSNQLPIAAADMKSNQNPEHGLEKKLVFQSYLIRAIGAGGRHVM